MERSRRLELSGQVSGWKPYGDTGSKRSTAVLSTERFFGVFRVLAFGSARLRPLFRLGTVSPKGRSHGICVRISGGVCSPVAATLGRRRLCQAAASRSCTLVAINGDSESTLSGHICAAFAAHSVARLLSWQTSRSAAYAFGQQLGTRGATRRQGANPNMPTVTSAEASDTRAKVTNVNRERQSAACRAMCLWGVCGSFGTWAAGRSCGTTGVAGRSHWEEHVVGRVSQQWQASQYFVFLPELPRSRVVSGKVGWSMFRSSDLDRG